MRNVLMKNWVDISFQVELLIAIYEWKMQLSTSCADVDASVKLTIWWERRLSLSSFYPSWPSRSFDFFSPSGLFCSVFFPSLILIQFFSITILYSNLYFSEITDCFRLFFICRIGSYAHLLISLLNCNFIVRYQLSVQPKGFFK